MQDQTTNTTQKRLRILGDDEIQALYGRPHFTDDERLEYFALSPTEKAMLEQLHSIKSRIYCILQLGYFKSHHMFFVFDLPEVEEDARYVQGQYFPEFQLGDLRHHQGDAVATARLDPQAFQLSQLRCRTMAGLSGKGPAGGNGVRKTHWLLLDSRDVDVTMSYNTICGSCILLEALIFQESW